MNVVPERLMPPRSTIERVLPVQTPELQSMYYHARVQWWAALQNVQRLIREAIDYGPGMTAQNIRLACENVGHYEQALAVIRSADIQLRGGVKDKIAGRD